MFERGYLMDMPDACGQSSVLDRPNSISNRDLLLARHRAHQAKSSDEVAPKRVPSTLVSRFLNRLVSQQSDFECATTL